MKQRKKLIIAGLVAVIVGFNALTVWEYWHPVQVHAWVVWYDHLTK